MIPDVIAGDSGTMTGILSYYNSRGGNDTWCGSW